MRVHLFNAHQNINAVQFAIFEPDIQNQQIRQALIQRRHTFRGTRHTARGIAFVLKNIADKTADILFIIYN